MHAEFRIDDTVIMIGDAGDKFPAIPSLIHVYVDDVDRFYAAALAASATALEEPRTR